MSSAIRSPGVASQRRSNSSRDKCSPLRSGRTARSFPLRDLGLRSVVVFIIADQLTPVDLPQSFRTFSDCGGGIGFQFSSGASGPPHLTFRSASWGTSAAAVSMSWPSSEALHRSTASRLQAASTSGDLASFSRLASSFWASSARARVGSDSASMNICSVVQGFPISLCGKPKSLLPGSFGPLEPQSAPYSSEGTKRHAPCPVWRRSWFQRPNGNGDD